MLKEKLNEKNLFEILGIENAPVDKKTEILNLAINLVEAKSFEKILDKLDKDTAAEFVEVLEKKDEKKLEEFFEKEKIDIVEILDEQILSVKEKLSSQIK